MAELVMGTGAIVPDAPLPVVEFRVANIHIRGANGEWSRHITASETECRVFGKRARCATEAIQGAKLKTGESWCLIPDGV